MCPQIVKDEPKYLTGQFLLAMPGMQDDRFRRSVIYICAHSEEGAMGFIINQAKEMQFPGLLVELGIVDESQAIHLPEAAQQLVVRNGGPVEPRRGFVLHSGDYAADSTIPVSRGICLTATLEVLRAISCGKGPSSALMTLGYSGWGAGQLEAEIADNGWLTCEASPEILFDLELNSKYDRLLMEMGIDPLRLAAIAGHA